MDRRQPDGTRHPSAIRPQVVEGLVSGTVEVHPHALDDVVEVSGGNTEAVHRIDDRTDDGIFRRTAIERGVEAPLQPIERPARRVAVASVVDDVICQATEGIERRRSSPLVRRQQTDRQRETGR